jgi:hypothetical protein
MGPWGASISLAKFPPTKGRVTTKEPVKVRISIDIEPGAQNHFSLDVSISSRKEAF